MKYAVIHINKSYISNLLSGDASILGQMTLCFAALLLYDLLQYSRRVVTQDDSFFFSFFQYVSSVPATEANCSTPQPICFH